MNKQFNQVGAPGKLPRHSSSSSSLKKKIQQNVLNPEKIGVLKHTSRRNKMRISGGVKRTTISHLDNNQKMDHQRRQILSAKKKSQHLLISNGAGGESPRRKTPTKKAKKSTKTSSSKRFPTANTNTRSQHQRQNPNRNSGNSNNNFDAATSPSRRTMDIHFLGLPNNAVSKYLQLEHMNLREEFKSKRKSTITATNSNKKPTKPHKRNHVEQESSDPMDIAKKDSLDSIYSFIDKKVHDLKQHSKKHSISYYKHHIHNGKK